ncbi:MAG: hypothetical protein IPO21_09520 [Bacteroidales bacterium]|nr:hypothetical protein [Bacteroidales bacterium]
MKIFKIYSVILFCIVLQSVALGQSLIDTNKVWNVLHRHATSHTRTYKFTKDTVIQNIKYKELRYSFEENFNLKQSATAGFIREEDSKYYIRYANGESFLLYDFSLNINDTVDFGFMNGIINLKFTVDTITYWNIDNSSRKVLQIRPLDNSFTAPQLWIEGIGSIYGIVEVCETQVFSDETALLCFKDVVRDTILWQSTLGLCHYVSENNTKTFTFESEIPKKGKVFEENETNSDKISFSNQLHNSGLKLKIFDESGELVESRTIKREKDFKFESLSLVNI